MLSNGANPNIVTKWGESILTLTVKSQLHDLCIALIEAGADVNKKDKDGVTAFDIFTSKFHINFWRQRLTMNVWTTNIITYILPIIIYYFLPLKRFSKYPMQLNHVCTKSTCACLVPILSIFCSQLLKLLRGTLVGKVQPLQLKTNEVRFNQSIYLSMQQCLAI